MFHRLKLVIAASIAVASFATSVSAVETPRVRAYSVKVNYSDLDLTSREGAREMLDRLERAAIKVCGGKGHFYPMYRTYTGRATRFFKECREDALSRAVAAVDSRELWYAFGQQRPTPTASRRAVRQVRSSQVH
jgi:UrcA family protein